MIVFAFRSRGLIINQLTSHTTVRLSTDTIYRYPYLGAFLVDEYKNYSIGNLSHLFFCDKSTYNN